MTPDLIKAAKELIRCVEYDVNGMNGKGGNGGLTSNETIRAAGDLRVQLDRLEKQA